MRMKSALNLNSMIARPRKALKWDFFFFFDEKPLSNGQWDFLSKKEMSKSVNTRSILVVQER